MNEVSNGVFVVVSFGGYSEACDLEEGHHVGDVSSSDMMLGVG
jgi:hypothetical protein